MATKVMIIFFRINWLNLVQCSLNHKDKQWNRVAP